MIISASRRTDIPNLYANWFMNRIRAGYVLTQNPFNPKQISKILLTPDNIDCIVFWTKDPENLIPYLQELDNRGFLYYFQFTLTPYNQRLERNLRTKEEIENTFINLSKLIGRNKVVWRYDPIILNDDIDIEYHKREFNRLCKKLSPYTDTVTISFVDMYKKVKSLSNLIRPINIDETTILSQFIGDTAKAYGVNVNACSEQIDLREYGISRASCVDKIRIEEIVGHSLDLKQDKNQRPNCGCYKSVDIGIYNTCTNNCIYCYANHSPALSRKRHEAHIPDSDLLIDISKEKPLNNNK